MYCDCDLGLLGEGGASQTIYEQMRTARNVLLFEYIFKLHLKVHLFFFYLTNFVCVC